jgi:hypothetical protein
MRLNVERRAMLVLAAALLATALGGCPGPTFVVQQYGGPSRPPETIATLRVNGGDVVRLLILDDQDVAAPLVEDGRLHIEILPIRHTVVVGNASAPSERYAPVTFQAEPGRVYRVAFAASEARVYEVDRGKDTPLRDVTLPPAGSAPSPAPRPAPVPPAAPAPPATPVEDGGAPLERSPDAG